MITGFGDNNVVGMDFGDDHVLSITQPAYIEETYWKNDDGEINEKYVWKMFCTVREGRQIYHLRRIGGGPEVATVVVTHEQLGGPNKTYTRLYPYTQNVYNRNTDPVNRHKQYRWTAPGRPQNLHNVKAWLLNPNNAADHASPNRFSNKAPVPPTESDGAAPETSGNAPEIAADKPEDATPAQPQDTSYVLVVDPSGQIKPFLVREEFLEDREDRNNGGIVNGGISWWERRNRSS